MVLFIGYDEFESQFRDAKPEICNNFVIVHHLHDAGTSLLFLNYLYMYRFPIFVLFIGYDEFESEFPDTKPEICNNSVIVHYLHECQYISFVFKLLIYV